MLRKRAVKRGRKQRVSRKHASKRGRKQRVSRKHSSTKRSQKHTKSEHKSPHSVHNKLHHSRKHAPTKRVSSAKAKSSSSIKTVAKTTTKAVRCGAMWEKACSWPRRAITRACKSADGT
jgi:hypothetical protein